MTTYLYWTRGTGFISRRIASITRPKGWHMEDTPSHVGLLFGDGICFEAHMDAGGWRRTTGLDLAVWLDGDPLRRSWYARLGDDFHGMWRARCEQQIGMWPYDSHLIAQYWGWRRLHIPFRGSKSWSVDCSEAVSRILYDRIDICAQLGIRPGQFGKISPACIMRLYQADLWEGLPTEYDP